MITPQKIEDKIGPYDFVITKQEYNVTYAYYKIIFNNHTIMTLTVDADNDDLIYAFSNFFKPVLDSKIRDPETGYTTYVEENQLWNRIYRKYTRVATYNATEESGQFIKSLDTITNTDVAKYLILSDAMYVKDKDNGVDVDVDGLAQLYTQKIKDGLTTLTDDFIQASFFNPYLSDLNINELFYGRYNFYNRTKEEVINQAFCTIIINDPYVDDTILVKDYVIPDYFIVQSKNSGIYKLIEGSNKFEKYVKDLTIEDFRILDDKINHYVISSEKQKLKIAEEILKNKDVFVDDETFDKAHENLLNIAVDLDNDFKYMINRLFSDLKQYDNNSITTKLIVDYSFSSDSFSIEDLKRVKCLFFDSKSRWIKSNSSADYVLYKLNKVCDVNKILSILNDLYNDKPLTVKQWDQVIDNYDDYEKIPVSLWQTLL